MREIDGLLAAIVLERHVPISTYRVQFSQHFTFKDATELVPYLRQLGISDLYASPLQRAVPGSTHGYDICDPTQLNPELGTQADFDRLTETLASHDMRLLLDIVPNHMGIHGNCNQWWNDVLENGPASRFASYFDIDWSPVKPELTNKLLLPILEDQYGNVLDSGKLQLAYEEGAFSLHYADFVLPVSPASYATILQATVEPLVETLGSDHPDILELQSILTAINHLPGRSTVDADALAERYREKEVIKRRLATLVSDNGALTEAIAATLAALNGLPGDPRSFDALDALVREQSYRLAYWRVAGEEINYRRFFDVNSMAAIHNELPEVFHATHDLILDLLALGQVHGIRVDHPDGLWNPPGYFDMLQQQYLTRRLFAMLNVEDVDERSALEQRVADWLAEQTDDEKHRPLYVVAEKILTESEPLPPDWAVSGTTGYDFMNQVNGIFVDQRNERAFDRLYAEFIGQNVRFTELEYESKRMIMSESLAGEINSLAHQLERLMESNRHYRDFTLNGLRRAIREIVACLGIYRTYITGPDSVSLRDQSFVEAAVTEAQRRNPRITPSIFVFLRDTLLLRNYYNFEEAEREALLRWVMRFQQVTGPVMAKSVEDTAFYVYNRLVSLNEVGGHPASFGWSLAEFHEANAQRQRDWPHALTSTSTHDTKRSEDVRARLNVLSEMPDSWAAEIAEWHTLNTTQLTALSGGPGPDENDEYLLYQALVGTLTDADLATGDGRTTYVERIQAYMAKATREAKRRTSWTHSDPGYDEAVSRFIAGILDPQQSGAFLDSLTSFARRIAYFGRLNSLSQTLLKLTSPGVPDTYRGTETWDFSLVDPDNRRPVDYDRLTSSLAALDTAGTTDIGDLIEQLVDGDPDGQVKLYLTSSCLRFRLDNPTLFLDGEYLPLPARGAHADHVCALARVIGSTAVVAVTPRLVYRLLDGTERLPVGRDVWGDTWLPLPQALTTGHWRNVLTGQVVEIDTRSSEQGISLSDLLARFPVGLFALGVDDGVTE